MRPSDLLVRMMSPEQKLAVRRFLYTTRLPLPLRLRITGALSRAHEKFALVAPDLSYVYVQVPKAASSTVKRQLWTLTGRRIDDGSTMRLHREAGGHLLLPDLTSRQIRTVLKGDGAFRFTFVRNPYDRLGSAYRDKVLNAAGLHPEGYDHGLALAGGEKPGFDAFVRAVAATDDERCDVHWMSQHRCGLFDIVDFHHVGRVETFQADMRLILARIAGPEAADARLAGVNVSRIPFDQQGARDAIGFTEELAELAFRRFQRDFELFGYDQASYARA